MACMVESVVVLVKQKRNASPNALNFTEPNPPGG
jgi:hypothetical protein